MEDLFALVSRCIDLQEYTEAIADVLNNPLWIMDQSYHILAYSHHPDASSYRTVFYSEESLMDHVAAWQQAGILDQVSTSTSPVHLYDKEFQQDLVIMDITVRSRRIGRLTVFVQNPVRDEDVIACSEGAAIYLRSRHPIRNHGPAEQLFSSLLNGEKVSAETVTGILETAGIPLQSSWRILCISSEEDSDYLTTVLRSDLDRTKTSWITLLKERCIYAMIPADETIKPAEKGIRIGVSFPFEDYQDTESCGKQAAFALTDSSQPVTCFSEVLTDFIPENLSSSISLSTLILPSVKEVIAYDREYATDYFETLKAYFENNESKAATSRALRVHLNTIKYRLQQITSVFGINLKKDAINIRISLMILKYLENRSSATGN